MEWTGVSSTSIAAVAYDGATATLFVRFRNGGSYAYYGVPASVHGALLAAESIGAFFNRTIRPRYPCHPL